jgi:2'-5' RNA ligase
MRLFAASFFSPEFTGALKTTADYARDNSGRDAVNWVDPGNFHLTYAFLGEVDGNAAAAAAEGLVSGLAAERAFRIVSGGFGVFPSPRHPGVLWVGIGEGGAELRALAAKISSGLAAAGLVFEDRFEPHVTIGRVKGQLPENFIRRVSDFAADRKASSPLSSVELMESVLTPEGPVYKRIHSKKLL